MPTATALAIGQTAPNFTLNSQTNQPITLAAFRGQWVVVFFYPKDQTPGCTQQACQLRDKLTQWEKQLPEQYPGTRVQVLGISGDSVASHQAFADKYKLTYPLLADEGNRVRTLWGVPKTMGMLPGRVTYLLDPQGMVRELFNSQMDIAGHIAAMDAALTQALSNPTTVSKLKTSAAEHTQP